MKTAATIGALAVVLALSGCSGGQGDLDAWVEQVKAKPAGAIDPIPDSPEYDRFAYQAHDLRDPFTPFKRAPAAGQVQGPRPDLDRPKEPLEEFALDSLKMVGTLGEASGMTALVMDPNGVTHRVRPGNRLGQRDGRLITVEGGRMILVELTPDGAGGWEEVQAVVTLAETE